MTKKPHEMTLEEIELELGTEVIAIRKRLLTTIYEKKLKENNEVE